MVPPRKATQPRARRAGSVAEVALEVADHGVHLDAGVLARDRAAGLGAA